ncbi:hypothetical protein B566_EDAN001766, partial [Ephemera danica]
MNIRSVVILIATSYFGTASGQVDLCLLHTNSYLQQFDLGAEWALQITSTRFRMNIRSVVILIATSYFGTASGQVDLCLLHTNSYLQQFDLGAEWALQTPDGFVGQYCRVKLNLTRISGNGDGFNYLQYAVCAPSSCDVSGVEDFTERLLDRLYTALNLKVSAEVIPDSCFYQGSSELDAGFWATISVFGLVLLVVVAMTLLEFIHISQWLFLK